MTEHDDLMIKLHDEVRADIKDLGKKVDTLPCMTQYKDCVNTFQTKAEAKARDTGMKIFGIILAGVIATAGFLLKFGGSAWAAIVAIF